MGHTLLALALPLFLITVVVERLHAWLMFRKAWRIRPRTSWLAVFACCAVLCAVGLFPLIGDTRVGIDDGLDTLALALLSGYLFYVGTALIMVGQQRERRSRFMAALVPILLVVIPGGILALFGSADPLRNGMLWLLLHLVLVSPAFLGPLMLLAAFITAVVSPFVPVERIPSAWLVRRRR